MKKNLIFFFLLFPVLLFSQTTKKRLSEETAVEMFTDALECIQANITSAVDIHNWAEGNGWEGQSHHFITAVNRFFGFKKAKKGYMAVAEYFDAVSGPPEPDPKDVAASRRGGGSKGRSCRKIAKTIDRGAMNPK